MVVLNIKVGHLSQSMSLKEYKIYVAVIYGNIYFYSEEKIYGIIFATNLKVGIIFFFVLKKVGKGQI